MKLPRVLHRHRWTLAALVAFFAVFALATPHRAPLYDGVGQPDEPYRFVQPPPGYPHTPPAGKAQARQPASGGQVSGGLYADSPEQGPQVSVYVPGSALVVPASAHTVTLTAVPLAPDRQPQPGDIDGNVYRVTLVSDVGAVTPRYTGSAPLGSAGILMRATAGRQPGPKFLYRAHPRDPWRILPTIRAGNDIYRTNLVGFGDYALAFGTAGSTVSTGSGGGGGFPIVPVLIAALVVALAGVVVAIRVTRSRAEGDGDDEEPQGTAGAPE